jgi:thioredoxin reductase (NADPH)
MYDVIIIGGGAAGLGAALYSARFQLKVLLIADSMGGTGLEAHKVDNWIGQPGISGFDLMQQFENHVKSYDIEIKTERVIEFKDKFEVVTDKGSYQGKTLILSTGMKHKHLGVKGEKEFAGKGVSYCYTCDAGFYPEKVVAVVGGGDSACMGASLIARYASKVILLLRSDFKAEPINVKTVLDDPKIEVMKSVEIEEIKGEKFVDSIALKDGSIIAVDGVFVEIGHQPVNELATSLGLGIDSHGFVKVDNEMRTDVDGVFAAGDICNATVLKQFITSAAQGSIAAQSAYEFVKKL